MLHVEGEAAGQLLEFDPFDGAWARLEPCPRAIYMGDQELGWERRPILPGDGSILVTNPRAHTTWIDINA